MKISPLVRSLSAPSILAISLAACQTGGPKPMSVEEAKQVTAAFSGAAFVPPPRTINDITAILDQQKRADPEAAAEARARADEPPPKTTDPAVLAQFYYRRGIAAWQIGRARQQIEDLTQAVRLAERAGTKDYEILNALSLAEMTGGSLTRAIEYLRRAVGRVPRNDRGWLIPLHCNPVRGHAVAGDLKAAESALGQCLTIVAESWRWTNLRPEWIAGWNAHAANARASVLEARGQLREAEAFHRQSIAALEGDPVRSKDPWVDLQRARLAALLARQGRLLEAENEARAALLSALSKQGRYSTHTGLILNFLLHVILEQGRYLEAETLARATVEIFEKTGSTPDSYLLAATRERLGAALASQGRWQEALAEYETVREAMAGDTQGYQKFLAGNVTWAVALLHTGQPDKAAEQLQLALERSSRLYGASPAELRGLLAVTLAARGDHGRALREFAQAIPVLLNRSEELDDENTSPPSRDQRLGLILASYIGLLAEVRGTPLEGEAGIDAAAEAFRIADVARGRSVQRALDASAARAAAKTPALADLVRREQDARKQISALNGLLANVLSQPPNEQDARAMADLRGQIDALRRARQALGDQIQREFPAYAQLVNPPPATLDQARALLKSGEAWVVTFVASNRTFVWGVSKTHPVAFAAAPMGEHALKTAVAQLRKALDPSAKTLGEIPDFDLALAHSLYRALLEPVRSGWEHSRSLLVVAHGPLAQLPFALLPTRPTQLGPEQEPLFANYRAVPWLARTHALTLLPSVSALATLRALPPGDPSRRPFIGFGDPLFSAEQARRAEARETSPAEVTAAVTIRGRPITLRSSPKTQSFDSSQLAMLPRLPDTADELRSIALAMKADLTREVFTGARANEKAVRAHNLSGYRVVAFATHGLVPGDLDGLTQPALALSAPEVADVDGDGLLTMEEILGLRLNADWVVLSACNTASGQGAGSEAVSGLGRAFFYAGARALLVSNWPVETTSARELTTDLFRRQSATPGLSRAEALQRTMNALIDGPGFTDPRTGKVVFTYAHPIFWAPFTLVGDGGEG